MNKQQQRSDLQARRDQAEKELKAAGWTGSNLEAFCDVYGRTLDEYVEALEREADAIGGRS